MIGTGRGLLEHFEDYPGSPIASLLYGWLCGTWLGVLFRLFS